MVESPILEIDKTDIVNQDPFDNKKLIKVMVGEPSNGMIDSIAHDNRLDFIMELARLESKTNLKFFTGNVGRTQINYARELMAQEAIKQGMDYLFMVDDDMILPKKCFERVFDCIEKEKADMVAPICTQRLSPFRPVIYKHKMVDNPDGTKNLCNDFIEEYEPNSKIKVDGIGFGVVLISVPFLKKLSQIMSQGMFFSNTNVGEDIWFCMMARQKLDAKIVVDTSVKVGHLRHPEIATEYDYVKFKGWQDKFKNVYRDGKLIKNENI